MRVEMKGPLRPHHQDHIEEDERRGGVRIQYRAMWGSCWCNQRGEPQQMSREAEFGTMMAIMEGVHHHVCLTANYTSNGLLFHLAYKNQRHVVLPKMEAANFFERRNA